ncbi:MAG: lysophospholipid acyltransferase family protein [Pirellulales bacterium]|nr:lysophospholipid acyltransferase family protein [Pirellulales bacterium]
MPDSTDPNSNIPRTSRTLYRGFVGYSRRLVARKFSALRIVRDSIPEIPASSSLLVYGNHPGWWDPLVGLLVHQELFPERQFLVPIEGEALAQYAILGKLGFFAVDRLSSTGTRRFLRQMQAIMERSDTAAYITPHGQFLDVRTQQAFQPGLAHVVSRSTCGVIVPMAIEYTFWNQSKPEILVEFGVPVSLASPTIDRPNRDQWNVALQEALESTQQSLAQKGIARSPEPFRSIIGGRVGAGGLYDFARRLKALATGKRFQAEHQ